MNSLFNEASSYCKENLEALLFENKIDELPDEKKQFFTFAFSCGAADAAKKVIKPTAAAGYSFGIYAALYSAGVCSFSDGLFLVDKAATIMKEASENTNSGMGIVVGLTREDIDFVMADLSLSTVLVTNVNHAHCHVVSGLSQEINLFLTETAARGAFKSERLEVEIPYHHREFLCSVPKFFSSYIDGMVFKKAEVPIASTIDGCLLTSPADLRRFVAMHPAVPISWMKALEALHKLNIRALFECGPGISLSQNGRFTPFETTYINVKKASAWTLQ